MQLLIPAAGRGQRFVDAGFKEPKPLIPVFGKPMLAVVLDNLKFLEAQQVYVLTRELLPNIPEFRHVIQCHVPEVTEGAACTALLAEEYLWPDEPLVIANSDQILRQIRWNIPESCEGGIFCFGCPERDPKWSYTDGQRHIGRVVEKQAISSRATCGVYYFKKASFFFAAAKQMIAADDRTNGEFYIAPCFNYMIKAGMEVVDIPVGKMWGLGTPEDLKKFQDEAANSQYVP